jgi:hypothetical protein
MEREKKESIFEWTKGRWPFFNDAGGGRMTKKTWKRDDSK